MNPHLSPADRKQFSVYYNNTYKLLCSVAHRSYANILLTNGLEAEDIVSMTMINAFEHFHNFKETTGPKNFYTWVCVIMKNLAINLFRKKKIEYHFVECMQTHERMCTHPTHQKDHLDYLEKIDSYNQAATVLECLSERDKNIILLRADEYSYQEIMSLLGLKESVVKTRLNRVRTKIKEKLSG